MKTDRLLFVWTSAEFATWDVARGYHRALTRRGLNIRDYKLSTRMRYHGRALGPKADDLDLLSRVASENVLIEAMRHRADWVFIVSGMALHPDAIWYLRRVGVATVVLFTESPYDDVAQREFHDVYPEMRCFTTERTSAVNGWRYLPHAYDPDVHYPRTNGGKTSDVLLLGTLWQTRIRLLERVDWSGITPRFIGTWVAPPTPDESSVGAYYEEGCVDNTHAPEYYASALICLNPFRAHPTAESLNPRAYELAACKAFQLADRRAEFDEVFGVGVVAEFGDDDPTLEDSIRYWLDHAAERRDRCEVAYRAVQPHTFDARADTLLASL